MCHIVAAQLLDPDAWKLRIPSWIGRDLEQEMLPTRNARCGYT